MLGAAGWSKLTIKDLRALGERQRSTNNTEGQASRGGDGGRKKSCQTASDNREDIEQWEKTYLESGALDTRKAN